MPAVQWSAIYPEGPGSAAAGGGATDSPGGADNPSYPGMPVGAQPIERDIVVATAGTFAVWTPQANKKFVLVSAFLSTDTAQRLALVDGLDVQGQRPVAGYFGANGGATPNLVPAPYPSKSAGQPLYLVTAAVGNTAVRVSGWEQDA